MTLLDWLWVALIFVIGVSTGLFIRERWPGLRRTQPRPLPFVLLNAGFGLMAVDMLADFESLPLNLLTLALLLAAVIVMAASKREDGDGERAHD